MWYALDNRTLTSIYSKPEPVCINLSSHIIVAATWVFKEVYGITGEDDLSSFIIHKELESHPPTEGQPKWTWMEHRPNHSPNITPLNHPVHSSPIHQHSKCIFIWLRISTSHLKVRKHLNTVSQYHLQHQTQYHQIYHVYTRLHHVGVPGHPVHDTIALPRGCRDQHRQRFWIHLGLFPELVGFINGSYMFI